MGKQTATNSLPEALIPTLTGRAPSPVDDLIMILPANLRDVDVSELQKKADLRFPAFSTLIFPNRAAEAASAESTKSVVAHLRKKLSGGALQSLFNDKAMKLWSVFTQIAPKYYPNWAELSLLGDNRSKNDKALKDEENRNKTAPVYHWLMSFLGPHMARQAKILYGDEGSVDLYSRGPGGASGLIKEFYAVEALTRSMPQDTKVRYTALDIAGEAAKDAAKYIRTAFTGRNKKSTRKAPKIKTSSVCMDFHEQDIPNLSDKSVKVLFEFGSTLSNLGGEPGAPLPKGALTKVFDTARRQLKKGDFFILGLDMNQDAASIKQSYEHDAFSAFHEGMMLDLGDDPEIKKFDPAHFHYINRHFPDTGQLAHGYKALTDGSFQYDGKLISYTEGQEIFTCNSWKFRMDDLKTIFEGAGFKMVRRFQDPQKRISILALQAV